jgi:hypothetical protein
MTIAPGAGGRRTCPSSVIHDPSALADRAEDRRDFRTLGGLRGEPLEHLEACDGLVSAIEPDQVNVNCTVIVISTGTG